MLQSTKKGLISIDEYILKMRGIADSLSSVGNAISDEELILYVLGGIGSEYESVVVNLTSRNDPLTLTDVQFMLQSHEIRLEQQMVNLTLNGYVFSPSAHFTTHQSNQYNNSGSTSQSGFNSGQENGRAQFSN